MGVIVLVVYEVVFARKCVEPIDGSHLSVKFVAIYDSRREVARLVLERHQFIGITLVDQILLLAHIDFTSHIQHLKRSRPVVTSQKVEHKQLRLRDVILTLRNRQHYAIQYLICVLRAHDAALQNVFLIYRHHYLTRCDIVHSLSA